MWNPILLEGKKMKKSKKKASAKVMEPPQKSKLGKGRCL